MDGLVIADEFAHFGLRVGRDVSVRRGFSLDSLLDAAHSAC